jgi:hypothetical protein
LLAQRAPRRLRGSLLASAGSAPLAGWFPTDSIAVCWCARRRPPTTAT